MSRAGERILEIAAGKANHEIDRLRRIALSGGDEKQSLAEIADRLEEAIGILQRAASIDATSADD